MGIRAFALLPLICLALAGPAQAASMYEFTFDQAVYTVTPGETVTVEVYLYETVTAGTTSVLATEQLSDTGVRISYDSSTSPTDPATVTDIQAASAFTDEPYDFADTYTGSEMQTMGGTGAANPVAGISVSSDSPVAPDPVPDTDGKEYAVLIGTVTFTAGDVVGETTTIKASDLFTNTQDTFTAYPYHHVLDSSIWSTTAQIMVVPEPACWVGLSGMGLTAGIFWKIRSRRSRRA